MYTLTDSAPSGLSLFDFPAPAGKVIGGAFDAAIETNPVPLFMLSRELNAARERGPMLQWWEADAIAKREGVKVQIPDDGISREALGILVERRKDDAARSLLFARKEGIGTSVGSFGAGLAATLLDPVNAAAGFIPVLGGTRYAAALAGATTTGARMAIRAGVGAGEGLVGAAVVEAPTLLMRQDLQDDYGLYDSLANIAFGTFASAGIRMVSGLARDRWRGLAEARREDFLRSVEPSEWAAMRNAYEAQLERGMFDDLEAGFSRGTGPDDALRARWQAGRTDAERMRLVDEAVARQASRFSDERIAAFVDAEARMRAGASQLDVANVEPDVIPYGETPTVTRIATADDRILLGPAGVAERKFRAMDLAEVKERIASGKGMVVVPGNEREVLEAISDETHANALKAAVAQAVEGRRIDVSGVLRTDPVFGPQRLSREDVLRRAESNMLPESKVGADKAASQRASLAIEESRARPKAEAPAVETGRADSPPPRGANGEAAGAEARGTAPKSPELAEVEARLAEARAQFEAAAREAGVDLKKVSPDDGLALKRAEDYNRAWEAIAACVKGKGV